MKEKLQEVSEYLSQTIDDHRNSALLYSYKAICENRFAGEEQSAQKAKENALVHYGMERGISTALFSINKILQEIK